MLNWCQFKIDYMIFESGNKTVSFYGQNGHESNIFLDNIMISLNNQNNFR